MTDQELLVQPDNPVVKKLKTYHKHLNPECQRLPERKPLKAVQDVPLVGRPVQES